MGFLVSGCLPPASHTEYKTAPPVDSCDHGPLKVFEGLFLFLLVWRILTTHLCLCVFYSQTTCPALASVNSFRHPTVQILSFRILCLRTHTILMIFLVKTLPIFQDLSQMPFITWELALCLFSKSSMFPLFRSPI